MPGSAGSSAGDISSAIHRIWAFEKGRCQAEFENGIKAGDVFALYNIQVYTGNLLRYAENSGEGAILEDLAAIYAKASPYLTADKDGLREWTLGKGSRDAAENPRLIGREVQLCSMQFLYLAASLIDWICHLEDAKRTPVLKDFCRTTCRLLNHCASTR